MGYSLRKDGGPIHEIQLKLEKRIWFNMISVESIDYPKKITFCLDQKHMLISQQPNIEQYYTV